MLLTPMTLLETGPRGVVGFDPGGRESGLVVRVRNGVAHHQILVSDAPPHGLPTPAYLNGCLDAIGDAARGDRPIAVEGITKPNPHLGITGVMSLVGTAMVLGAVLAVFPQAVVVRPGGHGSNFIRAYPADLQPKSGQGKGADQLRHCRSAYDIAGAGAAQLRLRRAR